MGGRQWLGGALALATALAAAPAAAQQYLLQGRTQRDGDFTLQVLRPTLEQDNAQLLCSYGDDRCVVFNRQMCTADYQAKPIVLAASPGSASGRATRGSTTARAFAWVQNSTTTCSNVESSTVARWPAPPGATQQNSFITPNYGIIFAGGLLAMTVPGPSFDTPADFASLTDKAILQAFDEPCSEAGVPQTRWRLCMGVDYGQNQGQINNPATANLGGLQPPAASSPLPALNGGTQTSTGSPTPTAWVEFLVATQRPPAPVVQGPTELYRRVLITMTVANSASTLREAVVQASRDPAVDGNDCNRWPAAVTEEISVPLPPGGGDTTDVSVSVPGDNGVPYRYCAYTRDLAGNLSQPAAPITATPQLQADPFAIAEGDLDAGFGFCRGHTGAFVWAWAGGWLLSRRWRCRPGRRDAGPSGGGPPPSPSS